MQLRLFPILIFATSAVLALKLVDLFGDRLSKVAGPTSAHAQSAPAPGAAPAAPPAQAPAQATPALPESRQAEQALNERLAERRRQVDERARELDMRENLVRAAETRLEQRMEELRRIEQSATQTNSRVDEVRNQQMRGLVTMYEAMKAKDAARIFDRLDMEILIEVVTRMRPPKVADVLAEMQPDAAKRLTVELARRSLGQRPGGDPQTTPVGGRELPRVDAAPITLQPALAQPAATPRAAPASGR